MRYILVAVAGIVVLGAFVGGVIRKGRRKPKRGTLPESSVTVTEPAADEPTPGLSQTASQSQVSAAEDRTPPA